MNIHEMPARQPSREEKEKRNEQTREAYITLAQELSERQEGFSFPGIDPHSYTEIKAAEEEFPGLQSIDEIIERLTIESMKVVLGSGSDKNVYILPKESNNIITHGLLPNLLTTNKGMDEKLRKFIEDSKARVI